MNLAPESKKPKKKIIAIVLGAILVYAVGSHFISSTSPKQMIVNSAKQKGKELFEKGKEKVGSVSNGLAGKLADGLPDTVGSGNVLKNVDSPEFVSIDNMPIKADDADIMLMNAIKAGDVQRVKYLVDSGVNIAFTDNSVCYDRTQYDFPKNIPDMKVLMSLTSAKREDSLYTNKCSKMFLVAAASELKVRNNPDEFFYYNRPWMSDTVQIVIDSDKAKMEEEKTREEIFKLILDHSAKKDYAILPSVFLNANLPFSIRKDALERFLSIGQNEPVTERKAEFLRLYDEATADILKSSPNQTQILSAIARYKQPWGSYVQRQVFNLFSAERDLAMRVDSIKAQAEADPSKPSLPAITVKDIEQGKMDHAESAHSALAFYGSSRGRGVLDLTDFNALHRVNNELALFKMIVDSKKVNLNYQDVTGNSVLHLIAAANDCSVNASPRGMAVVTRFLLNIGVNANLLNKEGKSAFMLAQQNSYNNAQGWTEISKAYSDKNYN
jgi:predicted transcriptional regulator